ncbi:hypothetical protein C8R43DRAFT_1142487 [Mycena crocata]|nr:hypothetical protein C8R43DRAFT_1142487 [Mycena crocata]
MSAEASVFATRYVSAVGVTVLLYDHCLTAGEEFDSIWRNPAAGLGYRAIFLVNRYLTEVVSFCRTFLWILALTTTVFTTLSNFILAMRVYTLWDHRPAIKWLLLATFGAALPILMVFSIFSAREIQSFVPYNPILRMCIVTEKPWALPFVLGVWVVFDFSIVILTVCNALQRPHQTQADVMTTLQHDGAKMFISLLCKFLRIGNLIVAIAGDATYCFVTFTVLWAMCSVVTSRMQLRVERLRFTRFGGDLLPINFLHM